MWSRLALERQMKNSEKTAVILLISRVFTCYFAQVTDLDDEVGSPAEEFKAFAADSGMNRSQSEYCNVGTKTYLTNHPAKKFVFDFMRVMIIDNLCLTPASKQTPLVDLLLEVQFLWVVFLFVLVLLFELTVILHSSTYLLKLKEWWPGTQNPVNCHETREKNKGTLVSHK